MARKVRFTGFSAGDNVTLSASKSGFTRGPLTVSAWQVSAWSAPTNVSVQISRYPEGPVLPGEVVIFYVTGVTGYAGNDHADLDFEWDFGDAGATYDVAQGIRYSDANSEYGRVVSHAYKSNGAKTATLTVREPGGAILTRETVAISIDDPDSVPWHLDLWIDFGEVSGAPDFTGAPPSGRIVRYITSMAALDAITSDGTQNIRMTFKKGETFTWGTGQVAARGRCYIRSLDGFGTGARPKCVAGAVRTRSNGRPRDQSMFNPGDAGDQSHIAIYGIDFDGTYDPTTGTHGTGGWACAVNTGFDSSGVFYRSFHQCAATGMRQFYGSEGTFRNNDPNKTCYLAMSDVDIRDWSNYGFSQFGVRARVGCTGVSIQQNPLALVRPGDGKSNSLTQAPDHGPIRISVCDYAGISNCNFASANGWSNLGNDNALQPCIRLLVTYQEDDLVHDLYSLVVANVQRNVGIGPAMMNIGANINQNQYGYVPRAAVVIERNVFTKTRQNNGAIFTATVGGVYLRNNIAYFADTYSAANKGAVFFALGDVENYTPEAGLLTDPVIVSFNTLVSDMSPASGDDSNVVIVNPKDFRGSAPVVEHNILQAATQETPATTDGPLDRANDFRPVVGSNAIQAFASGAFPIRDFDGKLRDAPTNTGAHDTMSAIEGTVPAPVNIAPPVISALSNFPDEYAVTDFGIWNHWPEADRYMVEWSWQIDGAPITDDYVVVPKLAGQSGILTCQITATNRSGVRISAESAGIPI